MFDISQNFYVPQLKSYVISSDTTEHIVIMNRIAFTKVEILRPNKVMRFTFNDTNHTMIKTICAENDTFNFEEAFYIALAKYFYGQYATSEGISKIAYEMHYSKIANKIVTKGIKTYEKSIREEKAQKEKEAELKAITANHEAKRLEKQARAIATHIKKQN